MGDTEKFSTLTLTTDLTFKVSFIKKNLQGNSVYVRNQRNVRHFLKVAVLVSKPLWLNQHILQLKPIQTLLYTDKL